MMGEMSLSHAILLIYCALLLTLIITALLPIRIEHIVATLFVCLLMLHILKGTLQTK